MRGGHCGHYEDNRERVQRHDPIATQRVAGSVKGATTRGSSERFSRKTTKTLETHRGAFRYSCTCFVLFAKPLGPVGNPRKVRFHWYGFQTKMTKPAGTEPNFHCACALGSYPNAKVPIVRKMFSFHGFIIPEAKVDHLTISSPLRHPTERTGTPWRKLSVQAGGKGTQNHRHTKDTGLISTQTHRYRGWPSARLWRTPRACYGHVGPWTLTSNRVYRIATPRPFHSEPN